MQGQLLVNPQAPFKFHESPKERYRLLTFAAMVAGKSAMPTAKKHAELLTRFPELDYQADLTTLTRTQQIDNALRLVGVGKYGLLTRFFSELQRRLAADGRFLINAGREDLIYLPGIGMKSASFYLLYTRPMYMVACLDVHILRFLRDHLGLCAPAATPSSKNTYLTLEAAFLKEAKRRNVRPWVLDIYLWSRYNNGLKIDDASFSLFVKDLKTNSEYGRYVNMR